MKRTPENIVKAGVRRYARFKGWLCETNAQGMFSKSGRPDMQLLKHGRIIYVECKSAKGRLGPAQKVYIDQVMRYGVPVIVAWSVEEFMKDLDELEEQLWPDQNTRRLC